MKKPTSTANADSVQLNLEFSWGQSIDMIRLKVGEKIDQIRKDLPVDVERINIQTFNTAQISVVESRVSAPGIDLSRNYDLIEERVINPIRRIPGVARVELNGIAPREVKIDLILGRITSHRLDIGALVQRLQGSNLNVAIGKIVDGNQVLHVRTFGAFEEVQVSLDRERAARYNVAPRDLAQTFGFMLSGTRLRKYRAGDKEVNVVLRLREEDVRRAGDLRNLTLGTARGQTVGTLAGFTIVRRPTAIERENRKTRVSVCGTYEGRNFSEAQDLMRKAMNDMAMPPGFTWSFGQQMEQQDQQNQQMLVNLVLALALIYLVMAA